MWLPGVEAETAEPLHISGHLSPKLPRMCAMTPRHGLARGGLGKGCKVPLGDAGGVCRESHATSMEVRA